MFVSAQYLDPDHTRVEATDDQGRVWQHGADSDIGEWREYLERGGEIATYVAPPVIFPTLSPRQVRLGLASIGIFEADVDQALASDTSGMIEWKYATSIARDHPLVAALGASFQLPADQIDALWLWASGL